MIKIFTYILFCFIVYSIISLNCTISAFIIASYIFSIQYFFSIFLLLQILFYVHPFYLYFICETYCCSESLHDPYISWSISLIIFHYHSLIASIPLIILRFLLITFIPTSQVYINRYLYIIWYIIWYNIGNILAF